MPAADEGNAELRACVQSGNLVRMIMGLKKNFGKWEGNGFLKNFETQQMRFVQSNKVCPHPDQTPPNPIPIQCQKRRI